MLLDDDADALREWQEHRKRVEQEMQPVFDELDRLAESLFGVERAAEIRREREASLRWSRALGQPVVLVTGVALHWGRN